MRLITMITVYLNSPDFANGIIKPWELVVAILGIIYLAFTANHGV
jgi:hypothetical protein